MTASNLHDAVRQGVEGSSDALYRHVLDLVKAPTKRAANWGVDPDDLVHDIFVSVYGAIQSGVIRSPERLGAYIAGTGQRVVCQSLRRASAKRVVRFADETHLAGRLPSPEQTFAKREMRSRVTELMSHLPKVDQEILQQFYFGEVPWQTIANDLHLTPNQFRLRKNRALHRIRDLAGQQLHAQ